MTPEIPETPDNAASILDPLTGFALSNGRPETGEHEPLFLVLWLPKHTNVKNVMVKILMALLALLDCDLWIAPVSGSEIPKPNFVRAPRMWLLVGGFLNVRAQPWLNGQWLGRVLNGAEVLQVEAQLKLDPESGYNYMRVITKGGIVGWLAHSKGTTQFLKWAYDYATSD